MYYIAKRKNSTETVIGFLMSDEENTFIVVRSDITHKKVANQTYKMTVECVAVEPETVKKL